MAYVTLLCFAASERLTALKQTLSATMVHRFSVARGAKTRIATSYRRPHQPDHQCQTDRRHTHEESTSDTTTQRIPPRPQRAADGVERIDRQLVRLCSSPDAPELERSTHEGKRDGFQCSPSSDHSRTSLGTRHNVTIDSDCSLLGQGFNARGLICQAGRHSSRSHSAERDIPRTESSLHISDRTVNDT